MATELEKLAACDAHVFYRDTCCYCETNLKLLRDGRALGHEEAAKLADMDGCERVGAAIRALSKEG